MGQEEGPSHHAPSIDASQTALGAAPPPPGPNYDAALAAWRAERAAERAYAEPAASVSAAAVAPAAVAAAALGWLARAVCPFWAK